MIRVALIAVLSLCLPSAATAQSKPAPKKTVEERLKELEDKVEMLDAVADAHGNRLRGVYARLDCDTKRFGSVQSDDPARFLFMVSCENVEPYLEGYRVTLHIGNPYSIRMTGVKGSLLYGANFPLKKAEIPLTQGLSPGQWTRAVVNISQAQATDMRWLRAEFFVEQVSSSITHQ